MTVFDLHAPAMKNLIDAGAKPAASAAEVVERCEIVLTCLPASPDVEAAYLESRRPGRAREARQRPRRPEQRPAVDAAQVEPRAKARGVHFLESPVSGGVSGARAGTLALMVGGDPRCSSACARAPRHGPEHLPRGAGRARAIPSKAINNMMACVNSLAMMEGVALGVKAGLDPMTVYEVVKASSGGSKALERIPSAIVPRNFEPGFKVRLMNKDLETFNTIAKELHVPVSFSNVAQRYQQAAMAAGLADMDTRWR